MSHRTLADAARDLILHRKGNRALSSRGGKRRALNLSPEQRSESARLAAEARWRRYRQLRESPPVVVDNIIVIKNRAAALLSLAVIAPGLSEAELRTALYLASIADPLQATAAASSRQIAQATFADCITTAGIVVDIKTTARKPSAVSQAHTLQLTTYALLAGLGHARIDVLHATARSVGCTPRTRPRPSPSPRPSASAPKPSTPPPPKP